MKFTIIHPTARVRRPRPIDHLAGSAESFRQHHWTDAAESAYSGCINPGDVQYLLVVHHSRIADFWADATFSIGWGQVTVVVNYGADSLVAQCNRAWSAVSGDIIVGNQDDMRYPGGWDLEISSLIPDPSALVCVKARTHGARPDLLTIPTIATRALCERIGPLSPDYDGMFSDDEWSILARHWGKVLQSELFFPHLHPSNGLAEADAVHAKGNSNEAYKLGYQVFQRRRAQGFPRPVVDGWPIPSDVVGASTAATPAADKPADKPGLIKRALNWFADDPQVGPVPQVPEFQLARRRLAVAMPTPHYDLVATLLNLVNYSERRNMDFCAVPAYCSGPDVTRMAIARTVLDTWRGDSNTPYVLWFDHDNYVGPEQLGRLIDFLDNNPQADIVTGWCYIRQGDQWCTSVGRFIEGEQKVEWIGLAELVAGGDAPKHIERFASGFPCVLMRREVLESLGYLAFNKIAGPQFQWGSLGEDFSFFWRAHEAGLRCYVDPGCKVIHMKEGPQEPDLMLPKDGVLPAAVEEWRQRVKGDRVAIGA